jgi:ubiquinone/menaquinone biosynthesis C-methylase UbiE
MNISKLFYHTIVGLVKCLHLYETRTNMYLEYIKQYVEKSNVLVDIGCGSGVFSKAFESEQRLIVALDIDKALLKNINGLTSERICGDAQCLPLCTNSIDCVISISVIEHLPKPEAFVKEICRILKSSAIVVIQLPNLQYMFEPHSKWPLLFLYPKSIQSKILMMLDYVYINMSVTVNQALGLLLNEGLRLDKSLKLYHLKVMKLLPIAPSYMFILKKC